MENPNEWLRHLYRKLEDTVYEIEMGREFYPDSLQERLGKLNVELQDVMREVYRERTDENVG